ncbi:MAG: phenylalanine--tRNA ligase subunit beta, partial [Phycisphaerae bacterium]|nr:phenylalanine--tRNA ligase subunit beta [Phycisphaerae bacterium]
GPSPEWMQARLRAIGQIPRNNLVDCTNFVLFEMGQPTHVFDLATLKGPEIRVRRAKAGEPFQPLGDGAPHLKLTADDLVIADRERPVALAGVKGGADTAVTGSTRDILLEAATFDGPLVRAMSRRHRVTSDSAYRFQRGVHPGDIDAAAARLAALVLETAGGELEQGVVEAGAPRAAPRTVSMRPARCRALLGIELPTGRMLELLEALELAPTERGDRIECTIPPRRIDLEREVDLIEEVARTHGLDSLPVADRLSIRASAPQASLLARRAVRDLLVGAGCVEAVAHSLVSERSAAPFLAASRSLLRIEDERAGGAPILRPSLLPSLLEVRRRNADAGVSPLSLFETASIFELEGATHHERESLGILIDSPGSPDEGFRSIRGIVERLSRLLLGADARMELARIDGADSPTPAPALAPAASVRWNDRTIGVIGLVADPVRALFGLEHGLAAAELEIRPFLESFPPAVEVKAMPAFPAIDRDLSVLVDESVPWRDIERAIAEATPARLESVSFVGTYRGKQTGARKSVTLRLLFRDRERTMRREEADDAVAAVVAALARRFKAELRA